MSVVMSGRSVNLTTWFLGRLRPPKQLTSTKCTHFASNLTPTLLESAEGETDRLLNPGPLALKSDTELDSLC